VQVRPLLLPVLPDSASALPTITRCPSPYAHRALLEVQVHAHGAVVVQHPHEIAGRIVAAPALWFSIFTTTPPVRR
jgi:hypothetical protein